MFRVIKHTRVGGNPIDTINTGGEKKTLGGGNSIGVAIKEETEEERGQGQNGGVVIPSKSPYRRRRRAGYASVTHRVHVE